MHQKNKKKSKILVEFYKEFIKFVFNFYINK